MNSPTQIINSFLQERQLQFKSLSSVHEVDFQEYCALMARENYHAYAFYSTKSKELAVFTPLIQIPEQQTIASREGSMSELFPKLYSNWFKTHRFQSITKMILPVEIQDKNIRSLTLIWIKIGSKHKFLITNYLKKPSSYE